MNNSFSCFVIDSTDEINQELVSPQFNFKKISIDGKIFFLLYLIGNKKITVKNLSEEFLIDIDNIIPITPDMSYDIHSNFFITGYNSKDFKFTNFKATLNQISSSIQLFDNISMIEVNIDECDETDLKFLSIFFPTFYPNLIITSKFILKQIRIYIEKNWDHKKIVTKSDIESLFNWKDIIFSIYFNSDRSIADVTFTIDGEEIYRQFIMKKVISTDDFTFSICKFANLKKIIKLKSLELKAEFFPSDFSLEDAYELFSDYDHIYRIQLWQKEDDQKVAIIQFTSYQSYQKLLNQKTVKFKSFLISISPLKIDSQFKIESMTTSKNSFLSFRKSDDESDENGEKQNERKNTIIDHFVGNISDDEKEDSDPVYEIKQLNRQPEPQRSISLKENRHFIGDSDNEEEEGENKAKSATVERNSKAIRLFISDSDDDSLLKENEVEIGDRHQNQSPDYLRNPEVYRGIVNSLAKRQTQKKLKFSRLYIYDVDDENAIEKTEQSMPSNLQTEPKKISVLKTEIDEVGSQSYSDTYREYGSYSDSEYDH